MVAKKPRIVIIGAGMAGITAANKLHTSFPGRNDMFDLCVVEAGKRIGGRINSSDFAGDRIEIGATWIHGIDGSPVHRIAGEIGSLHSDRPWEWMDGYVEEDRRTVAEGGFEIDPSVVDSVSTLFNSLMDYARGEGHDFYRLAADVGSKRSVGSFLREGLNRYWNSAKKEDDGGVGKFSRKSIEEAIFAMLENCQRNDTSACDLGTLDFNAESEYRMFPGEEITIAKGYLSVVESLASVLPPGVIQLDRKVRQIQWQQQSGIGNSGIRPVKLHFSDGSIMSADHVIITVSLGVLKAGIGPNWSLFNPPLPFFKTDAISRLGYGVVNKLFLQLSNDEHEQDSSKFPFLEMAFHSPNSDHRVREIPWWIRRTASLTPIHKNSNVLLSWFTGKEALELESLSDEEIINGVSATISGFLPHTNNVNLKFSKVLKSKWGNDPLFLGSYSYVAVGSSGDDLDAMAQPLPNTDEQGGGGSSSCTPMLQILFAGEATHRTHYSTTHGAYFSGIREANRLLQHYQWVKKGLDDYY
ncbi:Probable polyamine oxidase 5 [Linum perenne]